MYLYNIYIYVIIKVTETKCPPSYRHNGFVATHALQHMHMMYGYTLLVLLNQRVLLNKPSIEHNISGHK